MAKHTASEGGPGGAFFGNRVKTARYRRGADTIAENLKELHQNESERGWRSRGCVRIGDGRYFKLTSTLMTPVAEPSNLSSAAHVSIIMLTGTLDIRGKLKALQGPQSAHYVLEKPVDIDELEKTVEIALTECGLGETIHVLQSLDRAEKLSGEEPDRRFTERLARQHELLKRLRGSDSRSNISHLARDFKVSRKTIIRDLRDLIQRHQLDPAVYPHWKDDLAEEA